MNSRQCNYLLTIADSGSLSRASERLGISQPALSKFLSEQENQLGTALFLRHKKQLHPTAAGRVYLEAAQQFLNVKNNVLLSMEHTAKMIRKPVIRITSTPYRGAELLSRVYSRFSTLYPDCELSMDDAFSSRQEELIHKNKTDFSFGSSCHADYPDVCNIPIIREEVLLAVPSFHTLAHCASRDPDHLVSMPLQMFRDTPFILPGAKSNIRLLADKMFAQNGFSPVIAFESENNLAVDSMLKSGMGVGFITRRYLDFRDDTVYFRLDPPCQEITYLRYRTNHSFTQAERCLCGLIIQERMKIPGNQLISSEDTLMFLNAVPEAYPKEADIRESSV